MTNHPYLSRVSICLLSICILLVSGCLRDGPPISAAMVEGSRTLTEAEVYSRYAGNSIRFDITDGAKGHFREVYFAKDGSFQTVDFFREGIVEGTWQTHESPFGGYEWKNATASGFDEEGFYRSEYYDVHFLVNVLQDGTAMLWGRNTNGEQYVVSQPKPTPGFQGRARFNEIKRKISAASP